MTTMLSVKKAALAAGVSAGLVYRWVGEKRLPHLRLGGKGRRGKIAIDAGDLADFLAAQRVGAAVPPPAPPPKVRLRHLTV